MAAYDRQEVPIPSVATVVPRIFLRAFNRAFSSMAQFWTQVTKIRTTSINRGVN